MTLPSFDKGFAVEVNHTFAFYVYCIAGYCEEFSLWFFTVCKLSFDKICNVEGKTRRLRGLAPVVQVLGTAAIQQHISGTAKQVLRSVLQGN